MITLYLVYQDKNESSIMPLLSLYAFAGYRLMPNLQSIYGAIVSYRFYSPVLDLLIDDYGTTLPDTIQFSSYVSFSKIWKLFFFLVAKRGKKLDDLNLFS